MNVVIAYTLQYKSLDIYIAGCSSNPKCNNCHNPELWDYNIGQKYSIDLIKKYIEHFDTLIDKFMIMGGEPLDRDIDDIVNLLEDLQQFNKEIWLFTKYEINEIPEEIIRLCHYIKTGKYIPELTTNSNIQYGIKLATSNQKIYKIK